MPRSPKQKMKLLYLMKILYERTDEEHQLTMPEMITALAEYDISAERKSIYSDVELLLDYGMDIEISRGKHVGYYVASRDFELPELKLLVDAVQSSRIITARKSDELIRKLSTLTSTHQAKELKRQVFVINRPKTINESIYYNIDAVHMAINNRKKISFRYFDYDTEMKRVFRKNGELYYQSPIALSWSGDSYYLICYNSEYEDFSHFRIDRMDQVNIYEEQAERPDEVRFDVSSHVKRVFGMFSGEPERAMLRFDLSLVNLVVDRFGKDLIMQRQENTFVVQVEVGVNSAFFGWLFQFGQKAEILGPEHLRSQMAQYLQEVLNHYQN